MFSAAPLPVYRDVSVLPGLAVTWPLDSADSDTLTLRGLGVLRPVQRYRQSIDLTPPRLAVAALYCRVPPYGEAEIKASNNRLTVTACRPSYFSINPCWTDAKYFSDAELLSALFSVFPESDSGICVLAWIPISGAHFTRGQFGRLLTALVSQTTGRTAPAAKVPRCCLQRRLHPNAFLSGRESCKYDGRRRGARDEALLP